MTTDTTSTQKPNKFLIVDDDADIRVLMDVMLHSLGAETVLVENGAKALEILADPEKAKEFRAVFLDIMMPEVHGYEVLAQFRKMPHGDSVPIIMLTAKGRGEDIITGYQEGADYYIPKPFTKEQIVYGLNLLVTE